MNLKPLENSMNKTGELGERFFSTWCTLANLTVNKAIKDENGWDFLVEFPFSSQIDMASRKTPPEVKVQVKTTKGKSNSISVKLSTLEKFVKSPLPCFFCLIKLNDFNRIKSVYFKHIDSETISNILKKIRECQINAKKLTKTRFSINFKESNLLSLPYEECICDAINFATKNDLYAYVKNKGEIIKSVGYDKSKYEMKVTFKKGITNETLLEHSLGLSPPVEADKIIVKDCRFNLPIILNDLSDCKITIGLGDGLDCIIYLKDNQFSLPIELPGKYFFSTINRSLPPDQQKIKLICSFLNIVYHVGHTFHCEFDSNRETNIDEITELGQFLGKLLRGNNDPIIGININNKNIDLGTFRFNKNNYDDIESIVNLIIKFSEVIHYLQIKAKFNVTFNQIVINEDYIQNLYANVFDQIDIKSLSSSNSYSNELLKTIGENAFVVRCFAIKVGVAHYIGCFVYNGIVGSSTSMTTISFDNLRLVDKEIYHITNEINDNDILEPIGKKHNLSNGVTCFTIEEFKWNGE